MSVYTFEKSFLQRLDEIKLIFDDQNQSQKDPKIQWTEFLEEFIEPAGYSAIWKISRADCEDLQIRYPCEVFGVVQDTYFDDLVVVLNVEKVQDENVHLSETCRVRLEDLYPTVEQDNSALNVDFTADCLDRFRFFYNYIQMPWDDYDNDFVEKQLLPRMKLYFDLKNKQLNKGLSSHVRGMIAEAKYIRNKQENVENSINESGDDIDISHGESKDKVRKLLELHFRMLKIKQEMDILVNPELREIYEEVQFPHHQLEKSGERKVFAVTKDGNLRDQMQMLNELKNVIDDNTHIHWMSFNEAISVASAASEIYIPSGSHSLNFLEYLNGDILVSGLTELNLDSLEIQSNHSRINAAGQSSMLFAVDGNLQLRNLIIDCENVKTGFLIKDGSVTIKNCLIYGSQQSSVSEAFSVTGKAKLLIDNCRITNFATALNISNTAKVTINNSIIKNCNLGAQLHNDEAMISLEMSQIINCEENGILKSTAQLKGKESMVLLYNDKDEAAKFHIYFIGDANKLEGNKKGNVVVEPHFSETVLAATAESSMEI